MEKNEKTFSRKKKEIGEKIKAVKQLFEEEEKKVTKEKPVIKRKTSVKNTKKVEKVKPSEENTDITTDKTYIIPLGGIEEIGKNITVIQYRDEMIVIDAGLTFPEDEHLGVDLIIPSFEYLASNVSKVKALLITHGHEDHIGAVPYFYQRLGSGIPMYGGKLSLELALAKFEKVTVKKPKCVYISNRNEVKIGKYFTVEFISVTHSIPDCYAIRVKTPTSTILHTGDFKVDLTPVNDERFDFGRLASIGEEGVDLLLSDSTNAQVPGSTPSESTVGRSIDAEVAKAKGRVILASFASHVHRIQQIILIAQKYGRKVAIDGRSMLKIFEICSKLGYLKIPKNMIITLEQAEKMAENKVMIICTGTQGEPLSVLSRIANGTHKSISLRANDRVIISGSPIPGNEKAAYKNINQLLKKEASVIFEKVMGIHVSGHGCQEEQKLMINLIKPKYFMPVHGEYVMLKKHKELAMEVGMPEENIILAENGFKLELTPNSFKTVGKVPSGAVYIYGDSVGNVREHILRERQILADNGVLAISVAQNSELKFVGDPIIFSKGFLYKKDDITSQITESMKEVVRSKLVFLEQKQEQDIEKIKTGITNTLNNFFNDNIGKVPTVIVTVVRV
ncbi:ribonuclease J [Streptobacillus moniliformis]|uniref:ribonuclease J n=1 Tax=Streptobacillus moniliformis TaxID=34105 RepID=UPI0007EEC7DA|nr:ribonuclease J [Streptobacillus moniliformis]